MKLTNFMLTLFVIIFGAALLFLVMMIPPHAEPEKMRELNTLKLGDNFVHVFHDDTRSTTCYVLNGSISCVKDTTNAYEDLYR